MNIDGGGRRGGPFVVSAAEGVESKGRPRVGSRFNSTVRPEGAKNWQTSVVDSRHLDTLCRINLQENFR